jgi:hypothetical protein
LRKIDFIANNHVVVMPACPASFFIEVLLIVKNDPGQAGMTDWSITVPDRTFVSITKRSNLAVPYSSPARSHCSMVFTVSALLAASPECNHEVLDEVNSGPTWVYGD